MTDHQLFLWTFAATAAAFLATLATTWIAWRAARTWRYGLQQQRADECLAALYECAGAIGHTISRREADAPGRAGGFDLDAAWARWRKVKSTYAVARRYYPGASVDFMTRGEAVMQRLNAFCNKSTPTPGGGQAIYSTIETIIGEIAAILV